MESGKERGRGGEEKNDMNRRGMGGKHGRRGEEWEKKADEREGENAGKGSASGGKGRGRSGQERLRGWEGVRRVRQVSGQV